MDFSIQNHTKKRYYTCSQLYLFKNYIFTYLTLKLTFWPWRWPWIIQLISEMGGRFLWYLYDIRNSSIKDKVQIELIRKIYYITIWSYDFRTLKFKIFHWFRMQSFCYLTLDDLENWNYILTTFCQVFNQVIYGNVHCDILLSIIKPIF